MSTATAAAATAKLTAKEEREKIEESERIKRQSLETTVEDKIRRHVKQVMDAAQVCLCDVNVDSNTFIVTTNKPLPNPMPGLAVVCLSCDSCSSASCDDLGTNCRVCCVKCTNAIRARERGMKLNWLINRMISSS